MLGVSTVSIGASVDGWSRDGKVSKRWISHVRLADDNTHSAQWEIEMNELLERVTKESEKHCLIVLKLRQKLWSLIVLDHFHKLTVRVGEGDQIYLNTVK